jgi:hypothetical protein
LQRLNLSQRRFIQHASGQPDEDGQLSSRSDKAGLYTAASPADTAEALPFT